MAVMGREVAEPVELLLVLIIVVVTLASLVFIQGWIEGGRENEG